jgi:hypothetical protein
VLAHHSQAPRAAVGLVGNEVAWHSGRCEVDLRPGDTPEDPEGLGVDDQDIGVLIVGQHGQSGAPIICTTQGKIITSVRALVPREKTLGKGITYDHII